ncbi:hypothetical protein GY169_08200 [Kluyvera genomosp. 3]|uniref:Lipoprotein n=2 Tax=Kluyvera genomosp. 3 TaxID=2774055 RepID=A0A6G9RJ07_9ENTR|nr:hypothetical protein [Kluyvera genomosp. 3]QIR26802.1 hypothetical protein GY169_08200 [Kluyvera genomosp. 3]
MKAKIMLLAVVASSAILAGCSTPAQRMAACEAQGISKDTCYLSEQNRQQGINNAAMTAAYANAANATRTHDAEQHAQAAHVADPMREATLSSNVLKATLSNGFFSATINGKKAVVKRINANFYEIHGAGYIISVSMNADGIESASWNKTHGRENGMLTVKQ